jgi:mRNA degradation ribonuclease J1/J2
MRGFVFVKESENIIREITQLFSQELENFLQNKSFTSLDDFKIQLIEKVGKTLKRINGKNPVILPLLYIYDEPEMTPPLTTSST